MSQFALIDPILSAWATERSLSWYTEYQDTEVRTMYLKPGKRDQIQIAIDVPQGGETVVRVGQLHKGLSRKLRLKEFPTTFCGLSETLDRAMKIAIAWRDEDTLPS
jgi:hypothetical protein